MRDPIQELIERGAGSPGDTSLRYELCRLLIRSGYDVGHRSPCSFVKEKGFEPRWDEDGDRLCDICKGKIVNYYNGIELHGWIFLPGEPWKGFYGSPDHLGPTAICQTCYQQGPQWGNFGVRAESYETKYPSHEEHPRPTSSYSCSSCRQSIHKPLEGRILLGWVMAPDREGGGFIGSGKHMGPWVYCQRCFDNALPWSFEERRIERERRRQNDPFFELVEDLVNEDDLDRMIF